MKKVSVFCMAISMLYGCIPAQNASPIAPQAPQSANSPIVSKTTIPVSAGINQKATPPVSAINSPPAATVEIPIEASPQPSEAPIPTPSPTTFFSGSSGGGGGGSRFTPPPVVAATPVPTPTPLPIPTPTAPPDNKPVIQDLRLPEGPSVLGKGAPGAIRTDYSGVDVTVHAIGYFFNPSPSDVSVILDKAIPFTLTDANNFVLTFKLNTKNIPDLYLEGPHGIKIKVGSTELQSTIQVGAPLNTQASLFPSISSTNVTTHPTFGNVIEISGTNLMLSPQFGQVKLDGNVIPIKGSTLNAENTSIFIEIPANFDTNISHEVIYNTPFGIAFKNF